MHSHPHHDHPHHVHPHHQHGPSETGAVVLDIGADIGALALYLPATEAGREIEVSRVDGDGHRTHAEVRERHLDHGSVHCVLIAGLTAGAYTVWADATTPAGTVTITGGQITEVDWSTSGLASSRV